MKNNAAAFLCLWAKSKEFFVRSGTERYGAVRRITPETDIT